MDPVSIWFGFLYWLLVQMKSNTCSACFVCNPEFFQKSSCKHWCNITIFQHVSRSLASTTREQSITVSLNISTMQIYVDFNQPNRNNLQPSKESSSSNAHRLVVEPPHLKNLLVKLEIFPNFRGELSKNIWNHLSPFVGHTRWAPNIWNQPS